MRYRADKTGAPISILGFGCMRFTRSAGSIDEAKAEREILAAVERVLKAGKKSFAERCREFALANFDMEKNIRATYELYRELLNKE